MNFRPVFYICGILLVILSATMLIPTLVDLAYKHADWRVFGAAQIVTAFVGFALIFANRQKKFTMSIRETFILTTISWVLMAAFGALPLYLSNLGIDYTRAFFESMSGITTTGSTILSGLDKMPPGILIWRQILQWIGGIGFLVIALAILPLLQISGMQIYKSQSFGDVDKVLPSASQMAIYIFFIYTFFTILWTAAYHWAGMSFFDAISHAMSSISTGGYSTHDASVGHYRSALIEWICVLAMLSGGLPFVLYLKFLRGDREALIRDRQVRGFLITVFALTLSMTLYLIFTGRFFPFDALRNAAFMTVTLITTTGFANGDYTFWGPFIVAIAFLVTFIGSCSGSTSGAIKIFRFQILWSMMQQQLNKLMSPHGVFQVHYNSKVVDSTLQASIAGFFFIYLISWIFFGVLLQLTGLDFVTAFTGALTAISNVGPGLGNIIGPAGNFSTLNDASLWILSAAMLLGRLELFTVLVLLVPRFWRH